ncbi:MAG: peptidoglycan-binding protein [Candidatus Omnitrophota bacterium]|jgi:peptidoglycan hydrolase-like protein with peptidoglycan-binding domain
MRKPVFIILVMVLAVCLAGCGRKQEPLEEMQAPMSIETLATAPQEMPAMQPAQVSTAPAPAAKLEQLPPAGPYQPTVEEIQTALKNAGLYSAAIDGKSGPVTKKAIKEFQAANNLQVDGKVGPKTWAVLGTYLNTVPVEAATQPKRR